MNVIRTFKRSFAGGEITPELFGRVELPKFQTGLKTCKNAITLPHGPVQSRAGTRFIGEVKTSSKRTRLIPFSYSTTQTYALEFGDLYMRAFTNGAALLNGGPVFEMATPFAEADLFDLHFVQSADVLTVVHPTYGPWKAYRSGSIFVGAYIGFGPTIAAPTGQTATPTGSGSVSYSYKITAIASNGREEGLPSAAATCTNNLATAGNVNTVAWTAVSGAIRYNVYRLKNGLYGYIGQTANVNFVDDNIVPDTTLTPPESKLPFASSGNYPRAVGYHEQRKIFASTTNNPQTFWMTMSGAENNLNFSIPQQDSDGIEATINSREVHQIRHIISMADLIMLTSGGAWKVSAAGDQALSPNTVGAKPHAFVGASNVQPVTVNNSVLYAQARGGHVRELVYDWQLSSYKANDASIMAPHLFDGYTIVEMAFAMTPVPILYCVRSDGALLTCTYLPEHQVVAWHQHTTDGAFESICVIAEGAEDRPYAIVNRTIGGSTKRYVERLESRAFATQADAFCVDCGLSYSGAAVTSVSGLSHLEGKTVSILADGAVHAPKVVTGGSVSLDQAATKVHVGLPYVSDTELLPLALESAPDAAQGHVKNVNKAWLNLLSSGALKVGPDEDNLVEMAIRTTEPWGAPPSLVSGEFQVDVLPSWESSGSLLIRNELPLPFTMSSLSMEVAIGG